MAKTPDNPSKRTTWYPIEDAAKALGISRRTVSRRIQTGSLHSTIREDGRRWVEVTLEEDRNADALVGFEAINHNVRLAELLTESNAETLAAYRGRLSDLSERLNHQRRLLTLTGTAAVVGLLAVLGCSVGLTLLAQRQGLTAGQLSATVSNLDRTRSALSEAESSLAASQAELRDYREALTTTEQLAVLAGQERDRLADALSVSEADRQCLAEQLDEAINRADMADLMAGAIR